jgi:hypothetical protein
MSGEVAYKTHILIGVRTNGIMTVIAEWPHVPKQSEVIEEIRKALPALDTSRRWVSRHRRGWRLHHRSTFMQPMPVRISSAFFFCSALNAS